MTLPEDDPEMMEELIEWIYSHKYNPSKKTPTDDVCYGGFLNLFFFADKYDIRGLKGIVIDELVSALKTNSPLLSQTQVRQIYKDTGLHSGLRKLAIDSWKTCVKVGWYAEERNRDFFVENPEITRDLLAAFTQSTQQGDRSADSLKAGDYYDAD